MAGGVSLAFVHLPFGFDTDAGGLAAADAARRHGIRVIGSGACMHGLLDNAFLGLPEPRACAEPKRALEMLTSVADAADAVRGVGGWPAFQRLLEAASAVAQKHGVTVQACCSEPCADFKLCIPPVARGSGTSASQHPGLCMHGHRLLRRRAPGLSLVCSHSPGFLLP